MTQQKVLLVDDEPNILRALNRLLSEEDFEVVTCSSPVEALEILSQTAFAVLMSDQRMPEMSGIELLKKAREAAPDTIRMMLTAFSDVSTAIDAINQGAVFKFLTKPWDDEDLCLTLRLAVSQYEFRIDNQMAQGIHEDQPGDLKNVNQNLTQSMIERLQEIYRLNQDLKQNQNMTVHVMANILKTHSSLIWNHSARVSALSKHLANRFGIPEPQQYQLEIAALLHDIGKIGIPAQLLNKPENTLHSSELALLKSHGIQGEALVGIVPFLQNAAKMIRHHHEHFNGNGYPDGLKGGDIPIGSRLIAIVDYYDKLLHNRQNGRVMRPEEALEQVEKLNGHEFDPDCVKLLRNYVLFDLKPVTKSTVLTEASLTWEEVLTSSMPKSSSQNELLHQLNAHPKSKEPDASPIKPIIVNNANEYSTNTSKPSTQSHRAGRSHEISDINIVQLKQGGEVKVLIKNLTVGSILSQPLTTKKGVVLLPTESIITKKHLDKLRLYVESNYLQEHAVVYKKSYIPPA